MKVMWVILNLNSKWKSICMFFNSGYTCSGSLIVELPTYVLGGKQCKRENWPAGCYKPLWYERVGKHFGPPVKWAEPLVSFYIKSPPHIPLWFYY
jgi:hypothetical protein